MSKNSANRMDGAHKLGELFHDVRRRTAAALDKALSLLRSLSKYHAHHDVTERMARTRQVWPPRLGSLLVHVAYFLAISWCGYILLGDLKFRAPGGDGSRPSGIDLFFTSVSAATVSSMAVVEMEVFTNGQLLVLTLLMFVGGEVFVSLMGLASKWSTLRKQATENSGRVESHDELEMRPVADAVDIDKTSTSSVSPVDAKRLRLNAVRSLFFIVLAIFLTVHGLGTAAIAAYVYSSPGPRRTLQGKALNVWTFALFTTVSTFSNCGFMPNNENMISFPRDTGLQLLLVPLVLVGNTLFAPLLAACVHAAAAATRRPELVVTASENGAELTGYDHLLPVRRCVMLVATVAGLIAVQMAMMCGMEWGGALPGMSPWEKLSNALFLAVNARHTGESTVDLSTLAPAILVLFVLMMYLPPYTTWFPFKESSSIKDHPAESQGIGLLEGTVLSQLSYLTIFVIAICITERTKLKEDPLNFNLLSIVVEVVSAYGNVGFSIGYSCSRKINPDKLCTDRWTGLVGRWSDSGKFILILVMLFGRLKKFSMKGGKAWKLS
ncbi:probable cation transporter HKT1;4 [Lolium perenne]|uniref:probable cation transporter HKT1;4 n=1 Tax=Lolium perenne TaxID=4522 RepID=UPI0021F51C57|nr:probable cation transporter HKT1;4 isoform X1 [Lolium perenne]